MLQPSRLKHRKHFRGSMKGIRESGSKLSFGTYGLKSQGRSWLNARQIEAARKAIVHHTKRVGKLWVCIFPNKPYTKKASGATMGAGKGDVAGYVAVVRPGKMIFELGGVKEEIARLALKRAGAKLPIKTKFVKKD